VAGTSFRAWYIEVMDSSQKHCLLKTAPGEPGECATLLAPIACARLVLSERSLLSTVVLSLLSSITPVQPVWAIKAVWTTSNQRLGPPRPPHLLS